jgi:hypothetical protein
MPPLERLFHLVGRLCFPRQQDWQQTRSAKLLVGVLGFCLVIALMTAFAIRFMNNRQH